MFATFTTSESEGKISTAILLANPHSDLILCKSSHVMCSLQLLPDILVRFTEIRVAPWLGANIWARK